MLTDSAPEPAPRKGIRNYVIGSLVVFALALGYLGWVFWSRAAQNRAIEQRAAEQKRAAAAGTFEAMGGNRLEILAFYASPGLVHRLPAENHHLYPHRHRCRRPNQVRQPYRRSSLKWSCGANLRVPRSSGVMDYCGEQVL
jgi:hypothetical protein